MAVEHGIVSSPLVANARMYSVAPGAAAAWQHLFALVSARSGVALEWVEHAYPAPLDALWSRPDLGCTFMCGWPYAREAAGSSVERPIIAAPAPDADWAGGAAIYHASFLVRTGSAARHLPDVFGGRFAYNAVQSHSGYNLPRATLAPHAATRRLFAEVIGPFTTPRRCVEAVAEGHADVTAVDSYALLLLQRYDPELAGRVRVVARSASSPIPPVIGSPGIDVEHISRLRGALVGLRDSAAGRAALLKLSLRGFIPVMPDTYASMLDYEQLAVEVGYLVIR